MTHTHIVFSTEEMLVHRCLPPLRPQLCVSSSSGVSPPADGVHPVDGRNPERLVLGTCQAVTERAQTQALVVAATGTLHNVAHGLSVG